MHCGKLWGVWWRELHSTAMELIFFLETKVLNGPNHWAIAPITSINIFGWDLRVNNKQRIWPVSSLWRSWSDQGYQQRKSRIYLLWTKLWCWKSSFPRIFLHTGKVAVRHHMAVGSLTWHTRELRGNLERLHFTFRVGAEEFSKCAEFGTQLSHVLPELFTNLN